MRGGVHDVVELQHAETTLVRADLAKPGVLAPPELDEIRYLVGFARLGTFQPGASVAGRRTSRRDVRVSPDIVHGLRRSVLGELAAPIHRLRDPVAILRHAGEALGRLRHLLLAARARLLETHASDFSAEELDDEVGRKALVLVVGGGGGAGYVYLGAFERLQRDSLVPAYLIGSSMGGLLGLLRARARDADWAAYADLARRLRRIAIFRPADLAWRHGLPGLLRLGLRGAIGALFERAGERLTLADLPIPFEAVVAGVRRSMYERLPREFRHPETVPFARSFAAQVAVRMWRLTAFFNRQLVRVIVLGGDPLTSAFDAVDAAGFSAAIPGVLQYEVDEGDVRMAKLLDELFEREEVVALVDGGVADNVSVQAAWRAVAGGTIGTRSAVFLAFDSFHPQWDPAHLWLQPITRAVQLQMNRNRPYAHLVVRFAPTLSALNLLPGPAQLDRAIEWGRASIEAELPLIRRLLEPVRLPSTASTARPRRRVLAVAEPETHDP